MAAIKIKSQMKTLIHSIGVVCTEQHTELKEFNIQNSKQYFCEIVQHSTHRDVTLKWAANTSSSIGVCI